MDLQVPVESTGEVPQAFSSVICTHRSLLPSRQGQVRSLLLHVDDIKGWLWGLGMGLGSLADEEGLKDNSLPALSWSTITLVPRLLR